MNRWNVLSSYLALSHIFHCLQWIPLNLMISWFCYLNKKVVLNIKLEWKSNEENYLKYLFLSYFGIRIDTYLMIGRFYNKADKYTCCIMQSTFQPVIEGYLSSTPFMWAVFRDEIVRSLLKFKTCIIYSCTFYFVLSCTF